MPIATYSIGAPQHPAIRHDNGFLDRFHMRAATPEERRRYFNWEVKLELREAAQHIPFVPNLSDALAAYRHFLGGTGTDRQFSYERYVADDLSGTIALRSAIEEMKEGVESVYASGAAAGQSSFQVTGTAIPVGASSRFPYPQTENWQKAIGAHYIWLSANVHVDGPASSPRFTVAMTLHAEDRYNFNPGAADIATGIPDSDNGVFEVTGLAKQYTNYSTLVRTVSWTGHTQPAQISASPGRERQPADNRRARNRL